MSAIGFARIAPGARYPPPRHPDGRSFVWERGRVLSAFQIVTILSGRGELEFRSQKMRVEPGSAFFLPPGSWHRYRPDKQTGWEEQWIELRGSTIDVWLTSGLLDGEPVTLPKSSRVWPVFAGLHALCSEKPPVFRATASGMAMALVAEVISAQVACNAGARGFNALLRQARALLIRGEDVRSVSKRLGVSYQTFYRNFKRVAGIAPKEYARAIRLAHAEDLLAGTALSIKEIAARLGYHSASHLSLEFKSAHGISPSLYRGKRK